MSVPVVPDVTKMDLLLSEIIAQRINALFQCIFGYCRDHVENEPAILDSGGVHDFVFPTPFQEQWFES